MDVTRSALAVTTLYLAVNCGTVLSAGPSEARHIRTFGQQGSAIGQFNFPLGMIVDSQDRLIIADAQNNRIQICDEFGSCEAFGRYGEAPGQFINPHGVAVDEQDRIYTVETHTHRVQIFDRNGNRVGGFGRNGDPLGRFRTPGDVAIDNLGRVIVADEKNYRVQICSVTGSCTAFGSKGTGPGEFDWPRAVVVDNQNRYMVADRFNGRVQVCTDLGDCYVIGSPGSEVGQFDGPVELDLDPDGNLVIADRENHRVQVCDLEGDCWAFGSFGSGPGQFNHPLGVAVDSRGRIFVADSDNNRIQLFEVLKSFVINPGLNDAWYNPATNGQGFLITVFPDIKQLFLAWFTFDTQRPPEDAAALLGEPGHRWLTAQGPYSGDTANLTLYVTKGGVFDAIEPAVTTDPAGDGTLTIEFADCNAGLVSYEITSLGISGEIPIERLSRDNIPLCESLELN